MNIKGPGLFVGLQHIRPSPWDGLRSCVTMPRPLINGQAQSAEACTAFSLFPEPPLAGHEENQEAGGVEQKERRRRREGRGEGVREREKEREN